MNDPGANLIGLAVQGDRQALTALLEQHGPGVRRAMTGTIPSRWQSLLSLDDVMQEAYADAILGIGRFVGRTERAFFEWLKTLAKRNLVDTIRMLNAEKRGGGRQRVHAGREESLAALGDLLGATASSPSRTAARQDSCNALKQAIACLPVAQRRVIELFDLDGQSADQVAAALGRSPGAVYMLRSRAHRTLCDMLGTTSRILVESA